jgi:hypothetical protein
LPDPVPGEGKIPSGNRYRPWDRIFKCQANFDRRNPRKTRCCLFLADKQNVRHCLKKVFDKLKYERMTAAEEKKIKQAAEGLKWAA